MIQQRLKPLEIQRIKSDYPQVDFIKNNIQYIEINRGCKRLCPFCYADPNYKTFSIPEIKSNKVQIWGESILYDPKIKEKIIELGKKRVNNKVIYYDLGQGVDYRLLNKEIAELLSENRFGLINNKGNWCKGIKFAWDWGLEQQTDIRKTIELFEKLGYQRRNIIIFVLVNWKIDFGTCMDKLIKLEEWKVRIDDCTYDCTKKLFVPLYWKEKDYRIFRKLCRKHNQIINFNNYDPEIKN